MNVIPTRSVLILNTNTFRFPQHMRFAEDYYLWLTIVFNDFKFAYLPIPLAHSYKKNFGDSGLTQNTLSMHLGSIKCFHDLYINNHINYSTYIFFLYIEKIKYLKRILIIYIDKLLT